MVSSQIPCCCCLERPPDKQLQTTYTYLGKTEIYAEMLKDCLEINICTNNQDNGICEICITRLREAAEFKNQVQQCQRNYENVLKTILYNSSVKEEFDDPSDEINENKRVRTNSLLKKKKKIKKIDKKSGLVVKNEIFEEADDSERAIKHETETNIFGQKGERILILKRNKHTDITLTKVTEQRKHRTNFENILKYSNCTPFSNKTIGGIVCAYCKEIFTATKDLRTHIEDTHQNLDEFHQKRVDTNNLSYKIDITDLKCNICQDKFNLLNPFKDHLITKHNIKFYSVKNCILEFKLSTSDMAKCVFCDSSFETFKTLLQHMNNHYRNYVCPHCDQGFVNKHRLKNHRKIHELGSYRCSLCDKEFTTNIKRNYHEKLVHKDKTFKTNCPHCEETFNSYYQRNRHMYSEHKMIVSAPYICNICDKSFILKSTLTGHIKKVHLMEKNHVCSICGARFFMKYSLNDHMISHNGERLFNCGVCFKSYSRKKTLILHMRVHDNDMRFKCSICKSGFVQKCSLKSHMLSNHGIILSEFEKNATDV